MDTKLEEKLFKKYPKIFAQKDLDMSKTAMCWGIDTDDGWYDLIDHLCDYIQGMIDRNPHLFKFQIEATQIKSKYGSLRFYYTSVKNINFEENKDFKLTEERSSFSQGEIEGAISFAEWLSGRICESCGDKGINQSVGGWYVTLCPTCLKKYIKKRKIKFKEKK